MSKWDKTIMARTSHAKEWRLSNDSAYTLFFPSDSKRLWAMLCGTDFSGTWTFQDLYDLSRFVEDFALCDQVLVPQSFSEYFGPYIVTYYKNLNELPIVPFNDSIQHSILSFMYDEDSKFYAGLRHSNKVDLATGIMGIDNILAKSKGDINRVNSELMEVFSSALSELNFRQNGPRSSHIIQRLKECMYKVNRSLNGLANSIDICEPGEAAIRQGLCGNLDEKNHNLFHIILRDWAKQTGISVSPGFSSCDLFIEASTDGPLCKKLYKEVQSIHEDHLASLKGHQRSLEKNGSVTVVDVPPLLSILVDQAKDQQDIPRALSKVRQRFTPLRKSMSEVKAALNSDISVKEKIDIVRRIDSIRDEIIKKSINNPSKSLLLRVWDVVKKDSLYSAITSLADIIIDWDQERKLVGSVRHFVNMENIALSVKGQEGKLRKLFGEICK